MSTQLVPPPLFKNKVIFSSSLLLSSPDTDVASSITLGTNKSGQLPKPQNKRFNVIHIQSQSRTAWEK